MTIVAVGKSSFLAREMAKHPNTGGWLFLSHGEALAHPGWLDDAAAIINFAFPPYFKTQTYDAQSDVDSFLAKMIGSRPVHYIMLSSRMVYGQRDNGFGLTEEQAPLPSNPYGTSKLTVERSLESILKPEHLTILRLSNIFGFEKGRASFFGRMMTSLADSNKIIFDMGADTQRDFLAVHRLADALARIAARPVPGIFNIGAGFGAKCGDIAAWLIEGYGAGALEITGPDICDQFSLNVAKARKTWDLPVLTPAQLCADVTACGKMLRAASAI
jgi:UDP-glucose 4-epimerase